MSRALPVLLAAFVLAGCGSLGGEAADFTVGTTTIVDQGDLVRAAESIEPPHAGAAEGVSVTQTRGRLTEIEVAWSVNSCSPGTTLRLIEEGLRLEVERQPAAEGCLGIDAVQAVRLELGVAIDAGEVHVEEVDH